MPQEFEVTLAYRVTIKINDPDVIDRVLQNKNDEGIPQARRGPNEEWRPGLGWQDVFYSLDRDGVLAMLADNCGVRGYDLSQLDGWADLPDEAIKITGMNSELYDVYEIEPAGA